MSSYTILETSISEKLMTETFLILCKFKCDICIYLEAEAIQDHNQALKVLEMRGRETYFIY